MIDFSYLNPNYKEDNHITMGIIVHEAVHVKNMIYQKIGYRPKTNNDEAEAYFMEWIVDFIYNNYTKFTEQEKQNSINNKKFFDDTKQYTN